MIRNFLRRICTVNPLAIQGNFSFEVITKEKDAARFIDMMSDHFSRREMTAAALGCTKQDLYTLFDPLGEYFMKHQSALVAKDKTTDDIVSGLLGMDYIYELPPEVEARLSPKAQQLVEVWGWFKKRSYERGDHTKDMNTYFFIIAGFTEEAYEIEVYIKS